MNNIFPFRPRILDIVGNYSWKRFSKDLLAGIIVGVVALPLCIAFGIASGVSPEQGLITGIIAGFIVSLLGGSSIQIAGPTGAFIIVVYGTLAQYGIEGLAIASMMSGILSILLGLCKLGSFIKFIPYPIVIGFNSGIAVSIFSTQVKDFLGLDVATVPVDFVSKWSAYIHSMDTINYKSAIIAIVTIVIIKLVPRISPRLPNMLIAIILVSITTYILRNYAGISGIATIGDRFNIVASLPTLKAYPISMEMIVDLFPVAFTLSLLGAIVTLLSAAVADGVTGDRHDSNTELMAFGVANIIVPFLGGIPATGAIARTMTSINNGGNSPIAGIIHAITLLIIFLFLGPLTTHIPLACLAGMLVLISYNMGDWRTIGQITRSSKSEGLVLITTFVLTVVFSLTIAIEVGLLLALVLFIKRMSEFSSVSVTTQVLDLSNESDRAERTERLHLPDGVEVFEVDGPLFFGLASKFDECMRRIASKPKIRIIRMRRVPFMDATGLHNLTRLYNLSISEGIVVILSGVNHKVRSTLMGSTLYSQLGEANICDNIDEALERAIFVLKQENQNRSTDI